MSRRQYSSVLLVLCVATAALAQETSMKKVPAGVILVKGAIPEASDATTPLPEQGTLDHGTYRNRYFGLSYPIPAGYDEPYAGPPPSDTGVYVLGQYVPPESAEQKATLLFTASDLFFTLTPATNAMELAQYTSSRLPAFYTLERPPSEATIGGRTFVRFDYVAPAAQLHWAVLMTDVRCHVLQLVITSRETKLIETIAGGLGTMKLESRDAPLCIPHYATADNILQKVDAAPADHRYNRVPIRIVIDKEGKVKHVHLLSAFADQAQTILPALQQWRFKPYLVDGKAVEVETGIDLGTR